MTTKVKIIIAILLLLTVALIGSGFGITYYIQTKQTPTPVTNPDCIPGSCEYYSCDQQKVYNDDCSFDIVDGFCCTNYIGLNSSDWCNMNSYCKGEEEPEKECIYADQSFKVCERCTPGKSSRVHVTQGQFGCEFEYSPCVIDSDCGELYTESEQAEDSFEIENCSNDGRKIGDTWEECCTGENTGKIRILQKNNSCSFTILSNCIEDSIKCDPESLDYIDNTSLDIITEEELLGIEESRDTDITPTPMEEDPLLEDDSEEPIIIDDPLLEEEDIIIPDDSTDPLLEDDTEPILEPDIDENIDEIPIDTDIEIPDEDIIDGPIIEQPNDTDEIITPSITEIENPEPRDEDNVDIEVPFDDTDIIIEEPIDDEIIIEEPIIETPTIIDEPPITDITPTHTIPEGDTPIEYIPDDLINEEPTPTENLPKTAIGFTGLITTLLGLTAILLGIVLTKDQETKLKSQEIYLNIMGKIPFINKRGIFEEKFRMKSDKKNND